MIKEIFNIILVAPLYNTLVFLANIVPGHDIGLAIIILTVLVKMILFPLYHKSTKAQSQIKLIEPELRDLKEKYKDDKQEQAKQIMELYRKHGINPLTSIGLLFIQLPIILALFFVFSRGFDLHLDVLYPFISSPEVVNTTLLGLIDITQKSLLLAFLVGITQFIQMRLALPVLPKVSNTKESSFKDDLAKSMNLQMRYVMPVIMVFIAHTFPAAISVYWITSNLFAIFHELVVKKKALKFGLINQ